MFAIEGKYAFEKNENFDEYLQVLGVPWIARKMMGTASPTLQIKNENEQWIVTTSSMLRTVILKFKLGEEYIETMPGGELKNITVMEDEKLITTSNGPNNTRIIRVYEPSKDGCILTMKHETSNIEARRYFNKI